MPASELAAARAEIAKLQRVLDKKTLENEILKEAVEYVAEKSGLRARPCCPGRPVKTGLRMMGLARSHVPDLIGRGEDWADGRSHRTPSDDAGLLAELRQEIADLPSHGYRRACGLVTVVAQLPAAFEHFNEVHPHSSLKMRSPRGFRRQQAAAADQMLYCE